MKKKQKLKFTNPINKKNMGNLKEKTNKKLKVNGQIIIN